MYKAREKSVFTVKFRVNWVLLKNKGGGKWNS